MFERFTEDARAVVVTAVDEAADRHDPQVRPVHLFVGAFGRVDVGIDAEAARAAMAASDEEALAALGIDLEEVRRRVADLGGADAPRARRRRRPRFDPSAKRALELALRRALELGHGHIGAEHVLLGLVSTAATEVDDLLAALGTDRAEVERSVLAVLARAA